MKIKTCGVGNDVVAGKIDGLECFPYGDYLIISGGKEEVKAVKGLRGMDEIGDETWECEVMPEIYHGVKWEAGGEWGDGFQIFKYDSERIAF